MTKQEINELMEFYQVDTLEALIEAQAKHIEKLQSKLQPALWGRDYYFAPQHGRFA